jgi:GT2 family glycosyltransferase
MTELSIIIVNYNSLAYLEKCLASIRRNVDGVTLEIVVVDNASSCEDLERLNSEFPEIILVLSRTNLGFAKANNLGFTHCKGAYLLFLNPDTEIVGAAIQVMLSHLRTLPDAGMIGCKLLNADGSVQTSCIQRFPTVLNQALNMEYLRLRWPHFKLWGISPLFNNPLCPVDVQVISGACLMIKREAFENAGKFSEEYFMYGEDADLCYKIRQIGFKAFYTADASVSHYGGGSTKRTKGTQWSYVMQRRAILRFFEKTRGPRYARIYRITMGFMAVCRLAMFALLLPLRRFRVEGRMIRSNPRTWIAILKWSFGLERELTS